MLRVEVKKRLPGGFTLDVELEAREEILVLFGPSGAGKTLTLHTISGLTQPDSGSITLGETTWWRHKHNLPPRARKVGHVFQGYALFPHLSVLENVAFAKWPKRDRQNVARAMLEKMQLEHLATRLPHEISGGQQQRVAIARALVAEPKVLLLDEPFAAVDAAVRERLQLDLQQLQRELGLIIIYVTHDLEDAFVIGDRLAVMHDGTIDQAGPIADVLHRPASANAAHSLGVRNLFEAAVQKVSAECVVLDWNGLSLEAPAQELEVGARVRAYIRPESVKLVYPDKPLLGPVLHNRFQATVIERRNEATARAVRFRLPNDAEVLARFPLHAYLSMPLAPGDHVELSLTKTGIVLLASGQ